MPRITPFAVLALTLAGCGEEATLPGSAGIGANPALPAPHATLLPMVNTAPVKR